MTWTVLIGIIVSVVIGGILAYLTPDPRIEYLEQMEREGRPHEEILDAAFRMDL